MIILLKLILAHLTGDFLLQPASWVKEKEEKKAKSTKLYLHILVHGLLIMLFLWDFHYLLLALEIMIAHWLIDLLKLYFQRPAHQARWFFADQGLHFLSILLLWSLWVHPQPAIDFLLNNHAIWLLTTALISLTAVSNIVIRIALSGWSKALNQQDDDSLSKAGKYIGILERLFVFTFVVTNHWEAIGFLLAAKSVFRFGDLKEAKERKLTEYILIGTLLSFGLAIAIGMFTQSLM